MLPAGKLRRVLPFNSLMMHFRNCSSAYISLNPYTVPTRRRQDANIHNRTSMISKTARYKALSIALLLHPCRFRFFSLSKIVYPLFTGKPASLIGIDYSIPACRNLLWPASRLQGMPMLQAYRISPTIVQIDNGR